MSVLDEVRDLEDRIITRMRELAPLVREFEDLKAAAGHLKIEVPDLASGSPVSRNGAASRTAKSRPRRKAAAATRKPRTRRSRASAGTREEQILRMVRGEPGITVPAIADKLGVASTGLYKPVRKLIDDGQIVKDERELRPVEPEASTSTSEPADPAPAA